MGHVAEHVALELQRLAGGMATRGKTRAAGPEGQYFVVFAFEDAATGLAAGQSAVSLVNSLINEDDMAPGEVDDMVAELARLADRGRLGLSTQAIVDEARRRHIPWTRLDDRNLVELGWGVHIRRIRATVTSATSLIAAELARDKDEAGALLERAGVPMPAWRLARSALEAIDHARRLGYPVAVKPVDGNHGRGVSLDLFTDEAVETAFDRAAATSRRRSVIVQRQLSGRDYRILVIGGQFVACAERLPAGVVGDGRASVTGLIEMANADPRRGQGHSRELTRLRVDQTTLDLLLSQGLTPDAIPAKGRSVALSRTANLSTGGTSIDRTDEVHPDLAAMATLAARVVGLDVAGVDIVSTDHTRPLQATGGGIIEINAGPGFRMHTHPTVGRARNVGGAVLDQLFGRGSEGRIPIAAVTGSNGKTTTVRLLAHILSTAGRATGFTTTESIVANGLVLRTGDMAGPASARLILANPTIQAAVLEVARGGILRDGLGYDYNDVAIVTNVTGDHLGLDGISTMRELASVKAVIVDAVPRSGTAVLNADDPLVMEMAARCRGAVALVSAADDPTTPGSLAVRRHAESGGLVGYVESTDGVEHLIVRRGTTRHLRVPLANIPITWHGAARMHVANAVAAACGAIALDIAAVDVQRGLGTFMSSPGRVERHLIDGREIVLDYGHNLAALRAIGELIGRIGTDRRVVGVVSMPGDRRDEDRVAFGALAGSMFDRLFVAEPAIRGRPSGEAAALMISAARRAPDGRRSRSGEPTFIPDEADAARAAFVASRPGDLLVLCVANGPRAMAALLSSDVANA